MSSSHEYQSSWPMVFLSYLSLIALYINIFSIPPITLALMRDMGLNHFQAGLLMTVYTISYCVNNIFAGLLSDRFGPKMIMASGLFLAFWASMLFTYTSNFQVMLFSRVLMGFSAASMTSPCLLYILSWLPLRWRGLGVSGHLASLTLGSGVVFLMTPIFLSLYPWRWLLRIYALQGFFAFVLFFLLGRESHEKRALFHPDYKELKAIVLSPFILLLSAILFISLFQIGGTLTWLSPWLEERCRLSPIQVGMGSMAFALAGIPSSILGGYLAAQSKSGQVQRIVQLSMVGMLFSAGTGAFVWLEDRHYFSIILVIILVSRWGSFMSMGPLLSLVPRLVSPDARGLAMGMVNSIAISGGFFSSLLGGVLIKYTGQYQWFWMLLSLSLLFSALVLHPLFHKKISTLQ